MPNEPLYYTLNYYNITFFNNAILYPVSLVYRRMVVYDFFIITILLHFNLYFYAAQPRHSITGHTHNNTRLTRRNNILHRPMSI